MPRLQVAGGSSVELSPVNEQPVDIRKLKLEVLKNALCVAIFAGLGGYSLASGVNKSRTILSVVFYIITSLGLMWFIPRLGISTWRFLDSSSKPEYEPMEEEDDEIYGV